MPAALDLTGKRFGKLTAINVVNINNNRMWKCKCDCGNERNISAGRLNFEAKSCGCFIPKYTKHGLSKNKFYKTWKDIKKRCYNKNCKAYPIYGGSGVFVCDEWKNSPEVFIQWCMNQGEIPQGYSIDRYPDRSGPYAPWNCRWVPISVQNRNTKRNIFVDFNQEVLVFKDFVEKYGVVEYKTAKDRYSHGWSTLDSALVPKLPTGVHRS